MILKNVGNQLNKIQKIYETLNRPEQTAASALDKDLLLQAIRGLYELVLDLDTVSVLPEPTAENIEPVVAEKEMPETVETPVVVEVPVVEESPKIPEKKASFVFTHKAENAEESAPIITAKIEEAAKPDIQIVRKEPIIEKTPEVVEEKRRLFIENKVETAKPEVPLVVTPIITTPKIEEVPAIVEPPKAEVLPVENQIITTPKIEEAAAIVEPPKTEVQPNIEQVLLPEAYEPNPEYDELFVFQVATDISQKMGEKPIADIDKALSVGDKFLYMNQLFGGDAGAFKACREGLQSVKMLVLAREFLERNYIAKFNWMDKNRKSSAKDFMKLVRRLYL